MGCNTSRLDESEVLVRSLKRRRLMREALKYRQQFAFAHLAYIQSLQDVGHAICRFSEESLLAMQASPESPSPMASPPMASPQISIPGPVNVATSSPRPSPSGEDASPRPRKPVSHLDVSQGTVHPSVFDGGLALVGDDDEQSLHSSAPVGEATNGLMASPLLESHFRSLYYTPSPPFSPQDSTWDPFNLFTPSPIPFHLRALTKREDVEDVKRDETQSLDEAMHEEEVPDLEEEKLSETEMEQLERRRQQQKSRVYIPVNEVLTSNAEENTSEKQAAKEDADERTRKKQLLESKKVMRKESDVARVLLDKSKLSKLVVNLDEQFGKAYENGCKLSQMFETETMYPHLSILDLKDSSRLSNTITHYWASKTASFLEDFGGNDMVKSGLLDSHASTLETLYTWEKKLHKELKAGDQLHVAFLRKREQLSILDAKGEDFYLIEKTNLALKNLDSRLVVTLRAASSVSLKIQQLTKEELYPQLIGLVGGLRIMWKEMFICHETQRVIALEMQAIADSSATYITNENHKRSITGLEQELQKWHLHFCSWVFSQKSYISVLLSWMKVCLMQPEAHMTSGDNSPVHITARSPIYLLLKGWNTSLTCLEGNMQVAESIKNYAQVVHIQLTDVLDQLNVKKNRLVGKYHQEVGHPEDQSMIRNYFNEEKDMLSHPGSFISSMQENLPSIFEGLSVFAAAALREYEKLHQEASH